MDKNYSHRNPFLGEYFPSFSLFFPLPYVRIQYYINANSMNGHSQVTDIVSILSLDMDIFILQKVLPHINILLKITQYQACAGFQHP